MIGLSTRDTMAILPSGIIQRSFGMPSSFLEAIPCSANNQYEVIKEAFVWYVSSVCVWHLKAKRWCGKIAFAFFSHRGKLYFYYQYLMTQLQYVDWNVAKTQSDDTCVITATINGSSCGSLSGCSFRYDKGLACLSFQTQRILQKNTTVFLL